MSKIKKILLIVNLCILLCTTLIQQPYASDVSDIYSMGERILSFNSDIKINQDSSMIVTETITVNCLRNQIKRGIFRDFPTRYKDKFGRVYVVGFDVKEVLRDGNPERYSVEYIKDGKRVRIGNPDILLNEGQYTYTIKYYTNKQLGHFENQDELYWNVTGNFWDFPIDNATARVTLPSGINRSNITFEAYTGIIGSKGRNYDSWVEEDGSVHFSATKPLKKGEGLTIVVGWPKRFVAEPTLMDKAMGFIKNYLLKGIPLVVFGIVLIYYLKKWNKYGKDPQKGTIIPLFEPPNGISPAGARYIRNMGFDNKTLTSAIINMAVKKCLVIEEVKLPFGLKQFKLIKQFYNNILLSTEENKIAAALFAFDGEITLTDKVYRKIQKAISSVSDSLEQQFYGKYFVTNGKYVLTGAVISTLLIGFNILINLFLNGDFQKFGEYIGITAWLVIFVSITTILMKNIISFWKKAVSGEGIMAVITALVITLISLVPFSCLIMGFSQSITRLDYIFTFMIISVPAINVVFYYLLKSYTVEGRKIADELEGFKLYLGVAEKDRLNFICPVEKTPELFEKYLPYALALNVEQEWAEQFSDVFASISENSAYEPSWYSGNINSYSSISNFTSNFSNSFSRAVSSSSSPPGSSSGSSGRGGGGHSGGGGGGGGGGGW